VKSVRWTIGSRVVLALLVALLLLGSGSATPSLRILGEDGRVLIAIPLVHENTWSVLWNHSVTGNLVQDHYVYEGGQVVLTGTQTPAFDAGLGHIPGRGRLESDGNGGYRVVDINEPVPGNAYILRVGSSEVNHRIVHAGDIHSISDLAARERVLIEVVD